jgi:hypothetical protein
MKYRVCLNCGALHEGIEVSDFTPDDLKYDHCSVCFEDYDQFRDATEAEVAKIKRGKKINKVLIELT